MTDRELLAKNDAIKNVNDALLRGVELPTARELANDIRELYERGYSRALDNLDKYDDFQRNSLRQLVYAACLIDETGVSIDDVCERDYSHCVC